MIGSLQKRAHQLAEVSRQLEVLGDAEAAGIPLFRQKLKESGLWPLKPTGTEIFQVNLGKMCNQTCRHCHVDAGPDRKEIMTRETMEHCLSAVITSGINTVDLTGGAPEMNPNFRWFVEELHRAGKHILVRCNLTIIVSNPKYHDLPEFYRDHQVEVVSSLPYFAASRTDAQRGEGVFEKSIRALQMLNEVGYGRVDGLTLNLVYNPSGAFLPADQNELENQFKTKLSQGWNIDFNRLFTITNLPVSRFLEYLLDNGKYEFYMQELAKAYNPVAATGVMCRNTISVGWDGFLYDCDFNQMLGLKVVDAPQHVSDFNKTALNARSIVVNQHCYGCTAGAGSSCGGAVV